jgi:hypothetical protein
MPIVGKPRTSAPAASGEGGQSDVERETKYVAQVYVNRRKVWEGQGSSEDQVYQQAKTQKQKYESRGMNAVIVTKKSQS